MLAASGQGLPQRLYLLLVVAAVRLPILSTGLHAPSVESEEENPFALGSVLSKSRHALAAALVDAKASKNLCPLVEGGKAGLCVEACSDDVPCFDGKLCCFNGCGHDCLAPIAGQRIDLKNGTQRAMVEKDKSEKQEEDDAGGTPAPKRTKDKTGTEAYKQTKGYKAEAKSLKKSLFKKANKMKPCTTEQLKKEAAMAKEAAKKKAAKLKKEAEAKAKAKRKICGGPKATATTPTPSPTRKPTTVDPVTGLPIDVDVVTGGTKKPLPPAPVDPKTGLPKTKPAPKLPTPPPPISKNPINPITGLPKTPIMSPPTLAPTSSPTRPPTNSPGVALPTPQPSNPLASLPKAPQEKPPPPPPPPPPINPITGLPKPSPKAPSIDPLTGLPKKTKPPPPDPFASPSPPPKPAIDPVTGEATDPITGVPVNPETGQPIAPSAKDMPKMIGNPSAAKPTVAKPSVTKPPATLPSAKKKKKAPSAKKLEKALSLIQPIVLPAPCQTPPKCEEISEMKSDIKKIQFQGKQAKENMDEGAAKRDMAQWKKEQSQEKKIEKQVMASYKKEEKEMAKAAKNSTKKLEAEATVLFDMVQEAIKTERQACKDAMALEKKDEMDEAKTKWEVAEKWKAKIGKLNKKVKKVVTTIYEKGGMSREEKDVIWESFGKFESSSSSSDESSDDSSDESSEKGKETWTCNPVEEAPDWKTYCTYAKAKGRGKRAIAFAFNPNSCRNGWQEGNDGEPEDAVVTKAEGYCNPGCVVYDRDGKKCK
eukprot:TRINITY_DN67128_c0_g1_i1.p1 TRINITY_DN67128_c0_g1~~TRINITY_DN67128_c0_g1_i1.p1  ORF type:complete len:797 (-),score=186.93 TRINITY_DN67128_c0_g1_i1:54-2339(-)